MQADSFEEKPHDLNELLNLIVEQTGGFTEAQRTLIYLYDEDEKVLWNRAGQGAEFMELEFQLGKGLPGKAIESEEVINIPDVSSDPRFDAAIDDVTDVKVESMLVAPILDAVKGKRIGVIQCLNKSGGFDEKDIAFLKSVAAQAAIAIENTILFSSLQQIRQREQELAEEVRIQNVKLTEAYVQLEEKNKSNEESSKKSSRNKTIAVIGLLALFAGIGFWVWYSADINSKAPPVEKEKDITLLADAEGNYKTITVKPEFLSFPLTLSGILEPVETQNMFAPFTGRIVKKDFTIGVEVKKGDELLVLDDEVITEQYKKAQIESLNAQEAYEKYKNWPSGKEVADARRVLLESKQKYSKGKDKLDQSVKLHKLGIISDEALDNEKDSLENLKQTVTNNENTLESKLKEGDERAVETKLLAWNEALRKERELKDKLEKAVVTSGIDGVAIKPPSTGQRRDDAESSIEAGLKLNEDTIFLSVADLSRLRVLGRVDENDITKVKIGQDVKVRGSAFPGITLSGKVDYVSSEAKSGGRRPYFEIRVTTLPVTEEERKVIRLGMSADLSVQTYTNPNALLVPFEAIKISRQGNFVYKVKEGVQEPEKVQVTTGITTQDAVEVLSGVAEGDKLLILNS